MYISQLTHEPLQLARSNGIVSQLTRIATRRRHSTCHRGPALPVVCTCVRAWPPSAFSAVIIITYTPTRRHETTVTVRPASLYMSLARGCNCTCAVRTYGRRWRTCTAARARHPGARASTCAPTPDSRFPHTPACHCQTLAVQCNCMVTVRLVPACTTGRPYFNFLHYNGCGLTMKNGF